MIFITRIKPRIKTRNFLETRIKTRIFRSSNTYLNFPVLVFQVTETPGEVKGGLCCLLLLAGELSLPLALGFLALGAFFLGAFV